MADNKIDIIINAVNQTKPALAQIKTDVSGLKEGFNGIQGVIGQAGGAMQKFSGVVQTVAAGFMLLKGFDFFKKIADDAARVQALSTVLHQVASNAGITAGAIDKVDKSVQALGITAKDSRESLAQFIQAGLQATDASKLARAAQDLAVISGEDSSSTFRGLTQAIGEMSIMMLRWRGIMVTNEEAQSRYAAQMGKSVSALADWEKKQALLNMVLEKAKGLTGIYEAAMGDAAKQASSLARYQTEAANAVNNAFVPAYQSAITELTKFLQFVKGVADAELNSSDAAESLGASVKTVASAFRETLEFAIKHGEAILNVAKAYGVLKIAQGLASVGQKVGMGIASAATAMASGKSAVGAKGAAGAEAAASTAATTAKTAEARATDRLTASISAQTAALEKQKLARTATTASFVGPVLPNPITQVLNAGPAAQLAATTARHTSLLAAQAGVVEALKRQESARYVLGQSLSQVKANQLTLSASQLAGLKAEVIAADALVASAKAFVTSELIATEVEAKKLQTMIAQGAAAGRTAAAETVGKGGGLIGGIQGAGARIGAFFANMAAGSGVLARVATGIAGVGRSILALFGGPMGMILTLVGGWLLMGDGIKDVGRAFDYVAVKSKNALSHIKEFFAAKGDKEVYASERAQNDRVYDKEHGVKVARDSKSVESYKEAAMEAVRAQQEKIDFEYVEAPKAQKLKASHSKEDQDEAIKIEQEIVQKKLAAIAAVSVAESKLQALKASGRGKEADEVTSRLDKEAYIGGKKKQVLFDVQDLYKAREEGGGTKSVYAGGEAVSMGVSKSAILARRELEAYQKNLEGADKSIYRIKFALDSLNESATTLADLQFIKQERLDMFDAAAKKLKILKELSDNMGKVGAKSSFEKGSREEKAYKAEEADIKREAAITGEDAGFIAMNRKRKADKDAEDLQSLGDPSKAFKGKVLGDDAAAAYYISQKASGRITKEEDTETKTVSDEKKLKRKSELAAEAKNQGKEFDYSKDLTSEQLKPIIDDQQAELARKKFAEMRTELQGLSGNKNEINALNDAFRTMDIAIESVNKQVKGLVKGLDQITAVKSVQIERKYDEPAYLKSESAGSADLDIERKLAKSRELYELAKAGTPQIEKFATDSSNISRSDKIVTGHRAYEKEVESVESSKKETKDKDKAAGYDVPYEKVEAAETDAKRVIADNGGERIATLVKIYEKEFEIKELQSKKVPTADDAAKLASLEKEKTELEAIRAIKLQGTGGHAPVMLNQNPLYKPPEEVTPKDNGAAVREAIYKREGIRTAFNDGDPDKLKIAADKGHSDFNLVKEEAKDKVLKNPYLSETEKKRAPEQSAYLETVAKEIELKAKLSDLKEKEKAGENKDSKLPGDILILEEELKAIQDITTANRAKKDSDSSKLREFDSKEDIKAGKEPQKLKLETAAHKAVSLDNSAMDAAKSADKTVEQLEGKAKERGANEKSATEIAENEIAGVKVVVAKKSLEDAKKYYADLKAARDSYYNTYTAKVKGTKDLHKADIDLGSRIQTTAAEDAIDNAQIRIAPDKRAVGHIQAQESQQKFEAGASGHAEEIAAINKLANERKKAIMESGKDAAQIAKDIAGVEADSIAKRLDSSRQYFSSLETQRKEAKAKWKQYADEVVSIVKEIRNNTIEANAGMRDTMRSVMTAPAQLQDLKKEYKELMEAAKGAAAAGDFEQAKEYSKKAGTVAKSVAGHEGGQKLETTAESIQMQGDAAKLTNGILGQQGAIAKKNRDEQLGVIQEITEAMTGLAGTISDLSKKSEIILNPKLDEEALAAVEQELKGLAQKEDNAIKIILNAPDVAPIWRNIQDYFNENPIKATVQGNMGSSDQTNTTGSNSSTEGSPDGNATSNANMKANSEAYNKANVERKAEGGIIQGIGTGTSDSIPALLSHGEFVVKQAAVDHYGQGFLDLLNSKALRFASGGYVGGKVGSEPQVPTELNQTPINTPFQPYKFKDNLQASASSSNSTSAVNAEPTVDNGYKGMPTAMRAAYLAADRRDAPIVEAGLKKWLAPDSSNTISLRDISRRFFTGGVANEGELPKFNGGVDVNVFKFTKFRDANFVKRAGRTEAEYNADTRIQAAKHNAAQVEQELETARYATLYPNATPYFKLSDSAKGTWTQASYEAQLDTNKREKREAEIVEKQRITKLVANETARKIELAKEAEKYKTLDPKAKPYSQLGAAAREAMPEKTYFANLKANEEARQFDVGKKALSQDRKDKKAAGQQALVDARPAEVAKLNDAAKSRQDAAEAVKQKARDDYRARALQMGITPEMGSDYVPNRWESEASYLLKLRTEFYAKKRSDDQVTEIENIAKGIKPAQAALDKGKPVAKGVEASKPSTVKAPISPSSIASVATVAATAKAALPPTDKASSAVGGTQASTVTAAKTRQDNTRDAIDKQSAIAEAGRNAKERDLIQDPKPTSSNYSNLKKDYHTSSNKGLTYYTPAEYAAKEAAQATEINSKAAKAGYDATTGTVDVDTVRRGISRALTNGTDPRIDAQRIPLEQRDKLIAEEKAKSDKYAKNASNPLDIMEWGSNREQDAITNRLNRESYQEHLASGKKKDYTFVRNVKTTNGYETGEGVPPLAALSLPKEGSEQLALADEKSKKRKLNRGGYIEEVLDFFSGKDTRRRGQQGQQSAGTTLTAGIRAATGGLSAGLVPALVSHGEFRVAPDSVNHYGSELLHSINDMTFPKFAEGGMIGSMDSEVIQKFGEGGQVVKFLGPDPKQDSVQATFRNEAEMNSVLRMMRKATGVNLA